jgi:hypothetical protein
MVGGHAVLLTAGLDDCEHILSFHVRAGSLSRKGKAVFLSVAGMAMHWRIAGSNGSLRDWTLAKGKAGRHKEPASRHK